MIRINGIELEIDAAIDDVKKYAAKKIGVSETDFLSFEIIKQSIDSRKKNRIKFDYCVDISLDADEELIAKNFPSNEVVYHEKYNYILPENKRKSEFRPIIAGFGPAGIFCALELARAGLKPIVLERGNDVDTRTRDVEKFKKYRILNTSSNIQFGEGGAGTFSDGKLNTGIKDSRTRQVIREFVLHGAPEEILYSGRPHIGTDKLPEVIKNIRKEIVSLGGEVRFGEQLTDIFSSNNFVQGVRVNLRDGSYYDIETDCLVLCIGHSARDTFHMLYSKGITMEQKAFSVGARIEHPQELINKSQYGKFWNDKRLGSADYKLSNHPLHGRGAYTFCMCPGGVVVNGASEEGEVVTNGMSNFARDGENANSAILVGLEPGFFGDSHPLAGISYQRSIEKKAFKLGGGDYTAPAQLVGDFLNYRKSVKLGSVKPSCFTGVVMSDMDFVLPNSVTDEIRKAIFNWDKKIKGFALDDAVLTFPESRSTSPVRIVRDEFFQTNIRGLYSCGEGAGYAGGITSAAADGIKAAEAVLSDET